MGEPTRETRRTYPRVLGSPPAVTNSPVVIAVSTTYGRTYPGELREPTLKLAGPTREIFDFKVAKTRFRKTGRAGFPLYVPASDSPEISESEGLGAVRGPPDIPYVHCAFSPSYYIAC